MAYLPRMNCRSHFVGDSRGSVRYIYVPQIQLDRLTIDLSYLKLLFPIC